jgi:hypothetical protein
VLKTIVRQLEVPFGQNAVPGKQKKAEERGVAEDLIRKKDVVRR